MALTSTERSRRLRERCKKEGGKQVSLWLPAPLLVRPEAVSRETNQSLSAILLSAIDFGLDEAAKQRS